MKRVWLTQTREALFFLVTNTMIVLGLVTTDQAIAIIVTCPRIFPTASSLPSFALLPLTVLKGFQDVATGGRG